MENILHLTNDGSHTIYSKITEENYHSDNGAISESNHVFIKNGLAGINKTEISILEIGFGTGLNAFLSMLYAFENNLNITYTSIEKYPLKLDLVEKLNYAQMLNADKNLFLSLHNSDWEKTVSINKAFKICKINADLENYLYNADFNADLVFFDAFSPKKQPELWTENIFKRIYEIMNDDSVFCTYSSAGIVKQNLRNAGFRVKRLPGPKGKFHILNAFKA